MASETLTTDRNGQQKVQISAWQLVGTTIAIVASLLFMIWTIYTTLTVEVATERKDRAAAIDSIRKNDDALLAELNKSYTTLREHNEFANDIHSSIDRLTAEIEHMNTRVQQRLDLKASKSALNGQLSGMQRQIDLLSKNIDLLSQREDRRHNGNGGVPKPP